MIGGHKMPSQPCLCASWFCQVGGIRRIIVPVELGYPDNDYNKAGPKPSTFSGGSAVCMHIQRWVCCVYASQAL